MLSCRTLDVDLVPGAVLASFQGSTYQIMYASGPFFPAALLDDHSEPPGEYDG